MVVVDLLTHQSLSVFLIKPLEMMDVNFDRDESVSFEPVELKPRHYAKNWIPETEADVYTIYSPPQDREYEDWEIKIMRDTCKSFGVRFQLHPPPITEL